MTGSERIADAQRDLEHVMADSQRSVETHAAAIAAAQRNLAAAHREADN